MQTSPRCWKVELAAVIMVAATLLAATPARADFTDGLTRPLNLQAPDPAMEPPKMDAPSAIPPSAPPATSDSSGPFYKTPRFWVFAGLALVGTVALIWGGSQLIHEVNGGDPKACGPMPMTVACAGEGR